MLQHRLLIGFVIITIMVATTTAIVDSDQIMNNFSSTDTTVGTEISVICDSCNMEKTNSESASIQDEVREARGAYEFIVNSTGHYVVITDPETGAVRVLTEPFIGNTRPERPDMLVVLPEREAWYSDLIQKSETSGSEPTTSTPTKLEAVPLSLASNVIITSPGVYELTSDYLGSDQIAIDIQSSDVTIIGNGHTIIGQNPTSFSSGIRIGGSRVTISDVGIFGWDYGISDEVGSYPTDCIINDSEIAYNNFYGINLYHCDRTLIELNSIYNNVFAGIDLGGGSDNIVSNNLLDTNDFYGIDISNSDDNTILSNYIMANGYGGVNVWYADNNQFFDNFFVNKINIYEIYSSAGNLFSVTPFSGYTNIIGGNLIGGNFWGLPNASGFSQITSDSNNDGICDAPYILDANNRDSFPLAPGKTKTLLSLNAPATAYCEVDYDLNGRLTREDGTGIGKVLIFFGIANNFYTPWTLTDSNGYYHLTRNSGLGTVEITTSFSGTSAFKPSLSPKKTVNVVSQGKPVLISLNAPNTIELGKEYLVSGSVTSNGAGISVILIPEYSWDNSNWYRIFPTTTFRSGSSGHFEWKETISSSTSRYRYLRVRHVADCYYASVTSPVKTITILGAGSGDFGKGIFRPTASNNWILDRSMDGTIDVRDRYGLSTDKPLIGDFNNDGKADRAVFRASASNNWIIDYNMDGSVDVRNRYGQAGDILLVGDFNTDAITDRAVFRAGQWIIDYNTDGTVDKRSNYGTIGDVPLIGDFNNDGTPDRAVFRASASNNWIIDYSMDGSVDLRNHYGSAGDIPLVGDFNNDGITDRAVFRNGEWIIDYNMDGSVNARPKFGMAGDVPLVWNI